MRKPEKPSFRKAQKKYAKEVSHREFVYLPKTYKDYSEFFKDRITEKDFKGRDETKNSMVKWQREKISFLVEYEDWLKSNFKTPKLYVSQDKNIKTLIYMTEKFNYNREQKKPILEFTLKEYALQRGYTEEELAKGSDYYNIIKQDLISGARVNYFLENILIGDKLYRGYLPSFYVLFEPKQSDNARWILIWNSPYSEEILKILNKEKTQFFSYSVKELKDRETTQKPYLHLFYNLICFSRQSNEPSKFKKIINVLKTMGLDENTLKHSKESFEILKESISYFMKNYSEEFNQVLIAKYGDKNFIPVNKTETFSYENIQEICKQKGLKDWRDLLISFTTQKKTEKLLMKMLKNDKENIEILEKKRLLKRCFSWLKRNLNWDRLDNLTPEGTEKFLRDAISKLGVKEVERIFEKHSNSNYPEPIKFIKELSNFMKSN